MTDLTTLPHTGLQVPHDRYTLANLQQMTTRCGIAYNATVREGERCVGVIENDGNGGGSLFYPATAADHLAVHHFTTACRMDGRPLSEEEVLEHLITEHETGQETAKCARRGETLLRGFKEGDAAPAVTIAIGAPPLWLDRADSPFLPRLARDLKASDPGVAWEFWTGDQWKPFNLPAATD